MYKSWWQMLICGKSVRIYRVTDFTIFINKRLYFFDTSSQNIEATEYPWLSSAYRKEPFSCSFSWFSPMILYTCPYEFINFFVFSIIKLYTFKIFLTIFTKLIKYSVHSSFINKIFCCSWCSSTITCTFNNKLEVTIPLHRMEPSKRSPGP